MPTIPPTRLQRRLPPRARLPLIRLAAAVTLGASVAACGATFRNHGYVPPAEDLQALIVGVDTRDTIADAVGRPSASGVLRGDAWYYVRTRMREFGPLGARPVSREVVALSFAEDGTLANVERFGLEDGQVVALSRRVTETSIREFGLIGQLLRNFGRIDIGQALAGDDG
jgi:outer membrane protein assembly factor BamE (lipoprotein component of BamABCDE complex)